MKIISRAEAKALGLKRYFTSKSCPQGHTDERYVINGRCVRCSYDTAMNPPPSLRLYGTWKAMQRRCLDEFHNAYENYGGRGITVCERWLDPVDGYDNFVTDMGPRPEGFTLDRIDADGDYEPSNCRWADAATQCRNKRNTKLRGEDVLEVYKMRDAGWTLKRIAKHFSCYDTTVYHALKNREKYIEQGLGRCTKAA